MSSREYTSFIQTTKNSKDNRPLTPFNTPTFLPLKSQKYINPQLGMSNLTIQKQNLNEDWIRTLNVLKRDNIINEKEMSILLEDE